MRLALADGPRTTLTAGRVLGTSRAGSLAGMVAVSEFALLLLVAFLFQAIGDTPEEGSRTPATFVVTAVSGALVIVMANGLAGLYDRRVLFDARRRRGRLAAAAALGTMVVMFGALLRDGGTALAPTALAPVPLAVWFPASMAALLGNRWLLAVWLRRQAAAGRFRRNVLVIGNPDLPDGLVPLADSADEADGPGIRLVGMVRVADLPVAGLPMSGLPMPNLPMLGEVGELWRIVRDHDVTDVVVAPPWNDPAAVWSTLRAAGMAPVDVHLLLGPAAGGRAMVLEVARNPSRGWGAAAKRAEDLLLVSLLLVLLGPLMALVAVAVRLDSPGPVLFRQQRYGYNNRPFAVFKFRTMHVDRGDASGTRRTVRNDPRVTRLGRFLRRSSLDELPQLFNVLRGEMALVGPRAHPVTMLAGDVPYHEAVADYAARHRVRPGITGLAQINGLRGAVDTVEKGRRRVAYDLLYIDNLSLWLDLKILALTPLCLLKDDNAY